MNTTLLNRYTARVIALASINKTFLVLIALVVISFSGNSQASALLPYENGQESSDSVEAQLKAIRTASKEDENKVKAILAQAKGDDIVRARIKLISIYRRSGQSDLAKSLLDEILAKKDDYTGKLKLNIIVSWALFERNLNNYGQAALIMQKHGLPAAENDKKSIARVHNFLGSFYRLDKKLDAAEHHYMTTLKLLRELNDEEGEARLYGSLGVLYESLDNLVLAAEYQIKSMKYFEKSNDINELAGNYFNLGELYYRSKDYDKSLEFYFKALEYDKQLNSVEFIGYDYHRIGTLYLAKNQLVEAFDYTQKAIDIFKKGNHYQVLARSYVQQANVDQAMKNEEARIEHLLLAKDAAVKANVDHQLRAVWHALGIYYRDQGDFLTAKLYVEKSLLISNRLDLLMHRLSDNKLLSELHSELDEHELALDYLQVAFRLNEQLNDEQRIKEVEKHKRDINLLEEQVKVAKLEEASKEAQLEVIAHKEVTEKVVLAIIALAVFSLFVFYVLYQRRKIAVISANLYEDALKQKNQLLADVSHELRTPLTALKLQVDALRYQLVEDVDLSYQKLSSKITDLSNLIGDIYELAVSDVYGLSFNATPVNVIPLLDKWCKEFALYTGNEGFTWRYKLYIEEANVEVDTARTKQVLANLVSNSVKYTDKPGNIEFIAKIKHNKLLLRVQDTSPSVPEDELYKIFERLYRVEKSRNRNTGGSGLGLAICQNIIHAHQGNIYAKPSAIGGVAIYIELPLL